MPDLPHGPRIAVVGRGIGGLAAAGFLRRAGLTATVHEQASVPTEVGAGLVVAPMPYGCCVAWACWIGSCAGPWRWADGSVLSVEKLTAACERPYGERTHAVHRAHLLDTLRSAVPGEWIYGYDAEAAPTTPA
jgi:salicylate hydroxylase